MPFQRRRAGSGANKFNAKRVTIDGHSFDSSAEGLRYCALCELQDLGVIAELVAHPSLPLVVNGQRVGGSRPDFTYRLIKGDETWPTDAVGRLIVEDVKGYVSKSSPNYSLMALKMKLLEASTNCCVMLSRKGPGRLSYSPLQTFVTFAVVSFSLAAAARSPKLVPWCQQTVALRKQDRLVQLLHQATKLAK